MKYLMIIFVCLGLLACETTKENDNQSTSKTDRIIEDDFVSEIKDINENKQIVNHDFANSPFGFSLGMEDMDKLFTNLDSLEVKIIPIENQYNDELVDTLYSFTSRKKEFLFYKSQQRTFLNSAMIMDSSIVLSRGIHIGISKSTFLEKFKLNFTETDTFKIVDDEEYAEHSFYFKSGSLNRIEIYHTIE